MLTNDTRRGEELIPRNLFISKKKKKTEYIPPFTEGPRTSNCGSKYLSYLGEVQTIR